MFMMLPVSYRFLSGSSYSQVHAIGRSGSAAGARHDNAIYKLQQPVLFVNSERRRLKCSVSVRALVASGPSMRTCARKLVWQVEACASVKCVLELVPDSYGLWPTVTTMASSDSRLRQTESHMTREACPQSGTCSNSYSSIDILNWVTTIIANRLQLSPGDVSLDTKLEEMVFVGGNCDSNFRTVESLMDIEDLFSIRIYPNYGDILASCTVRQLANMIAKHCLLESSLLDDPHNVMHNSLLLERMLQSAVGSVLNIEEPLKLDINCKLSTYAANPRLLRESLRDLEGKFGLALDYNAFTDSTIQTLAKQILVKYNVDRL